MGSTNYNGSLAGESVSFLSYLMPSFLIDNSNAAAQLFHLKVCIMDYYGSCRL
jgi:hypothetical protein